MNKRLSGWQQYDSFETLVLQFTTLGESGWASPARRRVFQVSSFRSAVKDEDRGYAVTGHPRVLACARLVSPWCKTLLRNNFTFEQVDVSQRCLATPTRSKTSPQVVRLRFHHRAHLPARLRVRLAESAADPPPPLARLPVQASQKRRIDWVVLDGANSNADGHVERLKEDREWNAGAVINGDSQCV